MHELAKLFSFDSFFSLPPRDIGLKVNMKKLKVENENKEMKGFLAKNSKNEIGFNFIYMYGAIFRFVTN